MNLPTTKSEIRKLLSEPTVNETIKDAVIAREAAKVRARRPMVEREEPAVVVREYHSHRLGNGIVFEES